MGKVFRLKKVLPSLLFGAGLVLPMFLSVVVSANVHAAVPEGLVANDDDDFANVGELDTSEEIVDYGWKLNLSNLYSGRIERGDIRIRDLKLANATLEEYYYGDQNAIILVNDENEKIYYKSTQGNRTSLVYSGLRPGPSHYARLTFKNSVEIIQTGELLDFQIIATGGYNEPFIVLEDYPETNYTALLFGAKSPDGESSLEIAETSNLEFRVYSYENTAVSGAPLDSYVAIYDLDMPFCPAPGYIIWDQAFAEVVMPYQGFVDRRIFSVSGASINISGSRDLAMIWPSRMNISSCDNLSDDAVTRSLQAGFIMEANFGAGFAFDSVGTLGAQKIIDFNLVFPIVNVLAGKGGSVSATQQVVERNFGDPYVLQVTPDNGYNIKNIAIESLDTGATIKDFTLEDFLADSATVPGSVVTLDNGIQFKYKGDGVVNVILPAQYMLGANDVTQPNYDDFIIAVTFEDENGNADDPAVPNTSDAGKVENPNTDDSIYLPVLMLGAAATVLVAYRKRRQI
ncbi:hypothetical protein IKH83_03705 [Candidatus Saccharibacteria bacterium]|nr:hypothetical protein [Candidatus Saccharibacteria bacterium]